MGGAWGCGLPRAVADVVAVDTVVDTVAVVDDSVVADVVVVDIVVVVLAVVFVVPYFPAVPKTSCPSACGVHFSSLLSSPPTRQKVRKLNT